MLKGIFVGFGIFAMFSGLGYMNTHYDRQAVVIDNTNNIVTATDMCGYEWCYYGDDEVGTEVILKMSTNGTENIVEDDEVLTVEYK